MRMLVHPESAIRGEGRVKDETEDNEDWSEGGIVWGMEIACKKGMGVVRGRHRWSRGGMIKLSFSGSDSSSDSKLAKGLGWENLERLERVGIGL
jgi:hypothetical protein